MDHLERSKLNIERTRLRFFRDMVQAERFQVFRVFGIDETILEEVLSLSDERRLFNYLFETVPLEYHERIVKGVADQAAKAAEQRVREELEERCSRIPSEIERLNGVIESYRVANQKLRAELRVYREG